MPSGRGPATPIGIGVTGLSGVNIVAKSPYGFSLSLGETPLRGFSPRSTLCILCMQSVLKAPLFKKLLSSSGLGNTLRGFGGKVGNFWALEGANGGGGYRPKSESGG